MGSSDRASIRYSRGHLAWFLALVGLSFATAAQAQQPAAVPIGYVPADKEAAADRPRPDQTRILGGDIAAEGAWPWQVGLVRADEPDVFYGQFCGGSLIASVWILTAAHCVYHEDERDFSLTAVQRGEMFVLAGTNYLENGEGELIEVAAIYAHPQYDPVAIDNDIALIRLAHAPSSANVGTIRLPSLAAEQRYAVAGTPAIVTGWGRLRDGQYPVELRQVEIVLFDRAECNQDAGGPDKPGVTVRGPITDNMICSGVAEGGKGSCSGDSGGPLLVELEDNTYVQVGVVSWGYTDDNAAGCDLEVAFSAYTRDARYQDWITQIIANQ